MVEFFRSRTRRTDDGDEPAAETEWVSTGPGIYQPVTDTAGAEVARTEPSGEAPPFETLAAEPGRLGEHVASIVAAAEATVGLAIVIAIFRNRKTPLVDEYDAMRR